MDRNSWTNGFESEARVSGYCAVKKPYGRTASEESEESNDFDFGS